MKITEKLTSGRFLLTICAGAAFLFATFTGLLTAEVVALIIVVVFKDYFAKDKK